MARQPRIEYSGAIYHVTSRGVQRSDIVRDDVDRDTCFERVATTVRRYGWEIVAIALMTNHFHLFFHTPLPNLSRGMQFLLGGYANWWNRRHSRSGHVFQGRFDAKLVENESYFWAVSRYVHLNPVPALVERPEDWRWSTYAGYVNRRQRLPWVAYDRLLAAWAGEPSGGSGEASYRAYVESKLGSPVVSPFEKAVDGWLLGSEEFASRVKELISPASQEPNHEVLRRAPPLTLPEVQDAVCEFLGVSECDLARPYGRHISRPLLAYLARRNTAATLQDLVQPLGLSRRDSVPNLVRRVDRAGPSSEIRQQLRMLEQALGL